MDYIDHIILKQLMKILGLVAIGVAIGYFWCYQALAYQTCLETTQPAGWVCKDQKIIAGLDYHGIRFAECSETGELWFMRNGQRCQLYTQAFEWDFYEGI